MPAEGIAFAPRADLLTFEEIVRLSEVLAGLGVNKVRLTGGEPLSRRGLPDLVERLGPLFDQLAMTTNGVLLPPHLERLIEGGLTNFNLSLDTLRPDRFFEITRRDEFMATWRALELLLAKGLRTKINVVVMAGQNDDELLDFVALTKDRRVEVRFIEAMPFNEGDGNRHLFLSAPAIRQHILSGYPDLTADGGDRHASALRYRVPGHLGTVGIIPAYTRSLCGTCNRLRLTPKGTLLNCLYATKGLELRALLRSGVSNADLVDLFKAFVAGKHRDGHLTERLEQSGRNFAAMTSIGG